MELLKNIRKYILPRPKLSREAFDAYLFRLPEKIDVKWFRDGEFIVGEIDTGDSKFVTQGLSADDFIEMVNESVMTISDIPENYFDAIKSYRAYAPSADQEAALRNGVIQGATISAHKTKKAYQLA